MDRRSAFALTQFMGLSDSSHHDLRPRPAWLASMVWGMLVTMSGGRLGRVEVGASGVALTALAGEWLSHTLEYVRVWGLHRAFGSVHVYMGPVGVVLVVAALAGVHSTIRLVRRLERRRSELRRVQAGRSSGGLGSSPLPDPSRSMGVPALVAIVWATQCGLYLLQENLESGVVGHRAPGLSVLRGAHASALLVHLAVALALVTCLWLARHQVTQLGQVVRLAEARLHFVRRHQASMRPCLSVRVWTPIDRWGTQLWSRPPPALRVA